MFFQASLFETSKREANLLSDQNLPQITIMTSLASRRWTSTFVTHLLSDALDVVSNLALPVATNYDHDFTGLKTLDVYFHYSPPLRCSGCCLKPRSTSGHKLRSRLHWPQDVGRLLSLLTSSQMLWMLSQTSLYQWPQITITTSLASRRWTSTFITHLLSDAL